jgi:hypothetical protein
MNSYSPPSRSEATLCPTNGRLLLIASAAVLLASADGRTGTVRTVHPNEGALYEVKKVARRCQMIVWTLVLGMMPKFEGASARGVDSSIMLFWNE